ncbi:hypothetical protein D5S17_20400 [Pseudonocardiaceae bacterium YIM PH 21723]|nr:hypothetical protein D5S17_20400 [Pseudonocardiaceae bacterium YIM PH 21723]
MPRREWVPDSADTGRPSAARVYDYFLGGMHNFAADRANATAAAGVYPDLPRIMRANRSYLGRVVRYLVRAGIRQFLDLGSGIPTAGNVHELAHALQPRTRIVYVDIDPVAVAHSEALVHGDPRISVLQADVRQVESVLQAAESTLDFERPIGVLMVSLLHFIPENPGELIRAYLSRLDAGSYVALSHVSTEGPADQLAELVRLSGQTSTPLHLRPRTEIEQMISGLDLVEPGLVYLPQWHPDLPEDVGANPERANDYAAVIHKP